MTFEIRPTGGRFIFIDRDTRTVATWGDLQKRDNFKGFCRDKKRRASTDSRDYAQTMCALLNEKPDVVADRMERRARASRVAAKRFFEYGNNERGMDDLLSAIEDTTRAATMHRLAVQGA